MGAAVSGYRRAQLDRIKLPDATYAVRVARCDSDQKTNWLLLTYDEFVTLGELLDLDDD